jgi:hypothetical protein
LKENSLNVNLNIFLTNDQIEKLKLFSDQKINNSYLIQEVTFILSNEMLGELRSNKIGFIERFSTNFLNVCLDSRLQLAFFSILTVNKKYLL